MPTPRGGLENLPSPSFTMEHLLQGLYGADVPGYLPYADLFEGSNCIELR